MCTRLGLKNFAEGAWEGKEQSALRSVKVPKNWWGCMGYFKGDITIPFPSTPLQVPCLYFCPKDENSTLGGLVHEAPTICLRFESDRNTEPELQRRYITYFYYIIGCLIRRKDDFYRVWVEDRPSPREQGRRKLKLFFADEGIDTYQNWIALFDKVHTFLKHHIPTAEELKQTLIPTYQGEKDILFRYLINNKSEMSTTLKKIEARNCIWAGAPGTGKSYKLNEQAEWQFKKNILRVTFHPEYSFYDFVGTYRPKMNTERKIEYAFVPGPFAKILKRALWNEKKEYCLIIEEINRANAASVFGDMFQLLDRDSDGKSVYTISPSDELYEYLTQKEDGNPKETDTSPETLVSRWEQKDNLYLPKNLYLWATMNSADQGCFPMDTAFKRRWSIRNMELNPEKVPENDKWNKIRKGINNLLLEYRVPEDKLMGYYFLNEKERENLAESLKEKVMLYLFEDAAKPYRKDIFKKEYRTCADLREKLNIEAQDLGIFAKALPKEEGNSDT